MHYEHVSGAIMTVSGRIAILSVLLGLSGSALCFAQTATPSSKLFSDMRWREIGPMRAGRTRALAGVPTEPWTFYLGAVGGGVFKTTDSGETWQSLWDAEPTGSIGTIAVAASDPNIVYVGSGEGLARPDLSTGDGVYKSTDAGKTWTHLGLRDGQQIGQIAINPKDPNTVFVAVTGHPYGPNTERGLFRSMDGGTTLQEGALHRRQDRRLRGADRSTASEHRLRRNVAAPGGSVGERLMVRHEWRPLPLHRWR